MYTLSSPQQDTHHHDFMPEFLNSLCLDSHNDRTKLSLTYNSAVEMRDASFVPSTSATIKKQGLSEEQQRRIVNYILTPGYVFDPSDPAYLSAIQRE